MWNPEGKLSILTMDLSDNLNNMNQDTIHCKTLIVVRPNKCWEQAMIGPINPIFTIDFNTERIFTRYDYPLLFIIFISLL